MAARRLADRRTFKGKVLTLRMSEEDMLKFRLAALALGKKRAQIVRERVADLICGAAAATLAATAAEPAAGKPGGAAMGGTVSNETVIGDAANGGTVAP